MATRGSDLGHKPAEGMLVITRVFTASRDLVFKAWTEPQRLMQWWGPKGFTTPYCKVDLRLGGVFLYCMRSPEGRDVWGRGVYREISKPERIVYVIRLQMRKATRSHLPTTA